MARKIERELKREFPFAEIGLAGSGHYRLLLPNGYSVFVSSTPSCRAFLNKVRANVRRQLRQSGNQLKNS
jgi:hypothetical protein